MITASNPVLLSHSGGSFLLTFISTLLEGPQRAYFASAQVVKPDHDDHMLGFTFTFHCLEGDFLKILGPP